MRQVGIMISLILWISGLGGACARGDFKEINSQAAIEARQGIVNAAIAVDFLGRHYCSEQARIDALKLDITRSRKEKCLDGIEQWLIGHGHVLDSNPVKAADHYNLAMAIFDELGEIELWSAVILDFYRATGRVRYLFDRSRFEQFAAKLPSSLRRSGQNIYQGPEALAFLLSIDTLHKIYEKEYVVAAESLDDLIRRLDEVGIDNYTILSLLAYFSRNFLAADQEEFSEAISRMLLKREDIAEFPLIQAETHFMMFLALKKSDGKEAEEHRVIAKQIYTRLGYEEYARRY